MDSLAVIADDFSGCADAELQLFPFGLRTASLLPEAAVQDFTREYEVLVLDNEARSASADEAYRATRSLAERLKQEGVQQLFKKVDSTFRGNIGPELDGALDAFDADLCVLVPAFPSNGRVTRDGHHYVHGQLLSETDFARDPVHPMKGSYLPELLREQTRRRVGQISLHLIRRAPAILAAAMEAERRKGAGILIMDAETDRDLIAIAEALRHGDQPQVAAGSASMLGAVAHAMGLPRAERQAPSRLEAPVLVVNGSLHPLSARQIESLVSMSGARVVGVRAEGLLNPGTADRECERAIGEASDALEADRLAVLTTHLDPIAEVDSVTAGNRLAPRLGEIVKRLVEQSGARNLYIIGGWTSLAICRALEVQAVSVLWEIEPGIALCRTVGDGPDLRMTIKPGGFGSEQAIVAGVTLMAEGAPRRA